MTLNTGFFHHFPRHRFLNALALIHKAGQRRVRPQPRQTPARLPQQAPVALHIHHHRDDNRVGAGEVAGVAAGTLAHLPAAPLVGGMAAHRAEAVAQVPVQLGTGLRQHPRVGPGHRFSRRAAVLKMPARDILDLGSDGLVPGQVHREMADAVQHPEKYPLGVGGQRLDLVL